MRKKFYPSALLFLFLLFVPLVAQEEIESAQNTQNAEAKVRKPQKIITLQNNIVVTNLVGDSLLIGTDFGEVLELKLEESSPKLLVKLLDIASFYAESYAPKV